MFMSHQQATSARAPAQTRFNPYFGVTRTNHVRQVNAKAFKASPSARPRDASTPPLQPAPSAGSVAGAVALITGTTIGAGIIALPGSTIDAGFVPSASLLLGLWAVLTLEALLIVEVNLQCRAAKLAASDADGRDGVIPLVEMAAMTTGPVGSAAVTAVYLCLAFTLLMAYAARGGEILNGQLHDLLHCDVSVGPILFSASLALVMLRGGTSAAEKLNSSLTAILMALFFVLVGGGALQADWSTGLSHCDWAHAPACMPIMFLALMYHDLIPLLCAFLGFDRRKIRASLVCGSVLPLFMYVSWEAVCLALVPWDGGLRALDPIDTLIGRQGAVGGTLLTFFCLAALSTSFIGTGLSFIGYLESVLYSSASKLGLAPPSPAPTPGAEAQAPDGVMRSTGWQRALVIALAFAPPTICGMGGAEVFEQATHWAGGYGMVLLYGALPPVLAWRCRRQYRDTVEEVGGGRLVLAALLAVGVLAETLQLPSGSSVALPAPVFEIAASGDALSQAMRDVLMFIQ